MILTDKAKIEFEKWLVNYYLTNRKDYNHFSDKLIFSKHYKKTQVEQNALIIEWFDSVGVYIEIEIMNPVDSMYNYTIYCNNNYRNEFGRILRIGNRKYKTRQEATTKAIEKANEIFNNI